MSQILLSPDDDLLTTAEAAHRLRKTVNAMQTMRYRGTGPNYIKLPGVVTGRTRNNLRVRYPLSQVLAWAASNGVQTRTEAV